MPTDPYVPVDLHDRPRQEQNVAPGVHLPPARSWRATRPGDLELGWPEGELLGSPGPNVGYALKLVHAVSDALALADHEPRHDAEIVVADLAMRRASLAGRGPIPADVAVASAILGYDGSADEGFAAWRAFAVAAAGHDYPTRREIVDAVSDEVLLLDVGDVDGRVVAARSAMRATIGTD